MNKSLSICIFLLLFTVVAFGQTAKKRLPQNINVPTYSHIFPSVSGDGNQMIFLTNYTNSEGFETKYTYRTGRETWADPEPIPSINRPGMDHIGSFCISHDGNTVVFASRRTPSIGGYDIYISEKSGSSWSHPKNPGKPLNSPAHEGNPSMSPDGKTLYFMRCETMDNTSKSNCQIYVSHRISATRWSEAEALPGEINTYHSVTPRILADNQTLIFASGRPEGKGMLDLYSTSKENGAWTKPRNLSFINTEENDEFISVPARGNIMFHTGTYRDQYNIYMAMIPEEFRPSNVLMYTGTSTTGGQTALVQAYDLSTGEQVASAKLEPGKDEFTLFLTEGKEYDVSVFPQYQGFGYFSTILDLQDMLQSRKEEVSIDLPTITSGMSMPLTTIRYEDHSAILSFKSDVEIKRIIGFLKKNPSVKLEIGAYIDEIYLDSIPSMELTEEIADTTLVSIANDPIVNDTIAEVTNVDSLASASLDSTAVFDPIESVDLDVEPVLSPFDSLLSQGFDIVEETSDSTFFMKIEKTYHNDRTQKMADALMQRLIEAGVPQDLLFAAGYGDQWEEDHAAEERNYWIELKVTEY